VQVAMEMLPPVLGQIHGGRYVFPALCRLA
jgi:hypothetical protein